MGNYLRKIRQTRPEIAAVMRQPTTIKMILRLEMPAKEVRIDIDLDACTFK